MFVIVVFLVYWLVVYVDSFVVFGCIWFALCVVFVLLLWLVLGGFGFGFAFAWYGVVMFLCLLLLWFSFVFVFCLVWIFAWAMQVISSLFVSMCFLLGVLVGLQVGFVFSVYVVW